MTDRSIRLAASGAGRHCRRGHLGPALSTGLYDLVGFYDPSAESRAEVLKMAPTVRTFKTYEKLLDDANVDAVVVCGPDETHLDQAAQAIAAGKHVLVDKPVMASVDQTSAFRKMMDEAAARNLVLTTCLPRRVEDRYHPYGWVLAQLSELMEEFGKLLFASLDFSYVEPKVAGTWREGRSLLLDHFAHDGDFAYKVVCTANGVATLPFRAACGMDEPWQYTVTGTVGSVPFMCHGTRYEQQEGTYAELITLRFQRGICTVEVLHGHVELRWFASGLREFSDVMPINHASGGYDHRSMSMMVAFASAIVKGEGGHAYLTSDEFTMAAEAASELQESGLYVRR